MLIESLVVGLVLLAVRRKLLDYGKYIEFQWLFLPIVAFAIEYGGGMVLENPEWFGELNYAMFTLMIELAVYGLLMAFLLKNFHDRGFKLLGLGLLLNGVVVLLNGGYMPVDGSMLIKLGFKETYDLLAGSQIFAHQLMTETTRMAVLGDVLHIPPPYPFPKSISPGDVLMGLGVLFHLGAYNTDSNIMKSKEKEVDHCGN